MDHVSDVSPVEIAAIAAVLSEPARTAILIFLLDGRARTAGELAFVAGVSAPTASIILQNLLTRVSSLQSPRVGTDITDWLGRRQPKPSKH